MIDPSIDHAIAGIDGRLYLQLPQQTSSETFECSANNAVIGDSQSGYIHVNVEGKSPVIKSLSVRAKNRLCYDIMRCLR